MFFHCSAVDLFLKLLWVASQVSDHIAKIAILPIMFCFHDYPTRFVPGGSNVFNDPKRPLLLPGSQVLFLGLIMNTG